MDNWLPTLTTATPTEGYDLAIKLARIAVKTVDMYGLSGHFL